MKAKIKRQLEENFPLLVAALRGYRDARKLATGKIKRTPYNFLMLGSEEMQDGVFEEAETELIMSRLGNVDIFIDIGANIGYYTCLARSMGIKTVAVEPLAQNLDFLYANLSINGWNDVEVFPLGLASKPGIETIYGGSTGASLVPGWASNSEHWRSTISLSTLDILIGDRYAGKRLFIKMDVEGFEYDVIQGATKVLAMDPSPIWLVEICLTENQPNNINPHFREIFAKFWSYGYFAKAVDKESRIIFPEDVERWIANRKRDFGYVAFMFDKNCQ